MFLLYPQVEAQRRAAEVSAAALRLTADTIASAGNSSLGNKAPLPPAPATPVAPRQTSVTSASSVTPAVNAANGSFSGTPATPANAAQEEGTAKPDDVITFTYMML